MSANGKDYGYFFNSEKDSQQQDDRTYDADSFSEWKGNSLQQVSFRETLKSLQITT